MSPTKASLDGETFLSLYGGKHSAPILAALRAHLVDGWEMAKAARVHKVSRSGLYRALGQHTEASGLSVVTELCPTHRAEQLRGLIKKQVAIWKAADAVLVAQVQAETDSQHEGEQP